MELQSTVVSEILKALLPRLIGYLRKLSITEKQIEPNLEAHLSFVSNWCQSIQFYGMPQYKDTERDTIDLTIDTIPRKFRGPRKISAKIKEADLLTDNHNYILLGDPGSGKTTTLKRLAIRMLFEGPLEGDIWQFPIVIRIKDLENELSLIEYLANTLGIPFQHKSETIRRGISWIGKNFQKKFRLEPNQRMEKDAEGKPKYIVETVKGNYVGDYYLINVLGEILSECRALLLLDGLDEASEKRKTDLIKEIKVLSDHTHNCKIIVSCRSGDYNQQIEGFNVVEICPLDRSQKYEIANKWLKEPSEFLGNIENCPYSDLSDRPLFLTQLIVIYDNQGYLPDQPSAVYKKMVSLMLEYWDFQRGVKRRSAYAFFTPERKLEFLAAMSYQLTYQSRLKVFREMDLINAYSAFCSTFRLPQDEAIYVAQEIETHTGLIVQSGGENFEFSHLLLQEYLCAYYLVRAPFSSRIEDYLREYPSPVAIAVAISSEPSSWLAKLILEKQRFPYFTPESCVSFLSRLIQEKPFFAYSVALGFALLRICFEFPEMTEGPVLVLLQDPYAEKSFKAALSYYAPIKSRSQKNRLYLGQTFALNKLGLGYAAESGYLTKRIANKYINLS